MYPPDFELREALLSAPEVLCRGGSAIVAPDGRYLAGPLYGEEGLLLAELDMAEVARARQLLDVAGHYSRPDVFRLVTTG
jgi:nitrilase